MTDASARARLLSVTAIGVVSGVLAAFLAPWQFAVLLGWVVTAAAYTSWVWLTVGGFTEDETAEFATREDTGRVSSGLLLLGASVASLVGTAFDLVKARDAHSVGAVALTVVAVLTVGLSWTVVHTVFALRYAHEYYTAPVGGIDFKSDDEHPDYQDFAYIAFTIGMTFQVSDTDVQSHRVRRTALRHALIAYLFGAVILAVAINVIAGFVK